MTYVIISNDRHGRFEKNGNRPLLPEEGLMEKSYSISVQAEKHVKRKKHFIWRNCHEGSHEEIFNYIRS